VENALGVIAATRTLAGVGFPISDGALQHGLAHTLWPGRLELLQEEPTVFLDGAHNPAGARALASFWKEHFPDRRVLLVYGAMRDKAIAETTEILFPDAAAVILTQTNQARAAAAETIRDISSHLNDRLLVEPSPSDALSRAIDMASPEDIIFVTGSLFLVGDLRRQHAVSEPVPTAHDASTLPAFQHK
jgi:dihydrofolate synthase/folylpolyglutamate synthase